LLTSDKRSAIAGPVEEDDGADDPKLPPTRPDLGETYSLSYLNETPSRTRN
jgi:hypothetical protein